VPATLQVGERVYEVGDLTLDLARSPATPPPGLRLVLMADDLLEQMGTRTEDGARLSFEWGEPDSNGWYTPVITRHDFEPDVNGEILFLTSNSRIHDALVRCYPSDPSYATEMTRHVLRRLVIPTAEEL